MLSGREPKTFNDEAAPANYVAGIGRGAAGFTTRADIGPAQTPVLPGAPSVRFGVAPVGYVAGVGRGTDGLSRDPSGPALADSNYDPFNGYMGSLVAGISYDKADDEADEIYAQVERRRKRKNNSEPHEETKSKTGRIADDFADLKGQLRTMSYEEWDSLPEASTGIRQRKKVEKYTPVSDRLIAEKRSNLLSNELTTQTSQDRSVPGEASVFGATPLQSVSTINQAKNQLLTMNLDRTAQSENVVGSTTRVDPEGYLTSLASLKGHSTNEMFDIKTARRMYKSINEADPNNVNAWIARARIEEYAGQISEARKIITKGCKKCPTKEEVWEEAARLMPPNTAKSILAKAVTFVPHSVKLWLTAAELESADLSRKKKVVQKALDFIPNSVKLWQTLIDLEDDEDEAKILLSRATECVPESVEMWLALARLETYKNAQKVLNKARKELPAEPRIWIAACKLEESYLLLKLKQKLTATTDSPQPNAFEEKAIIEERLFQIIKRAIKKLDQMNVVISRKAWLNHAKDCEDSAAFLTCKAILVNRLDFKVDPLDQKRTFVEDALSFENSSHFFSGFIVLADTVLKRFRADEQIWLKFVDYLRRTEGKILGVLTEQLLEPKNDEGLLVKFLRKAVEYCPESEILWLMAAKELWFKGKVAAAREVINLAFKAGHTSERVWLAAAKLESENNETDRARMLLKRARESNPSARIFMKSALLERNCGQPNEEIEILKEGLEKFSYDKLFMMLGQASERMNDVDSARKIYANGVKSCPKNEILPVLQASIEERSGKVNRARSILEVARLKLKQSLDKSDKSQLQGLKEKYVYLWVESVRFEIRLSNIKRTEDFTNAQVLLNQALQEKYCLDFGELHALNIYIAPKNERKARSSTALGSCGDEDALIICMVGILFWSNRKRKKARKWLSRATDILPENGDIWATYYRFEKEASAKEGNQSYIVEVVEKCTRAKPKFGYLWAKTRKDPVNQKKDIKDLLELVAYNVDFLWLS